MMNNEINSSLEKQSEYQIDFKPYFIFLLKKWRMLFAFVCVGVAISIAVYFILPKYYEYNVLCYNIEDNGGQGFGSVTGGGMGIGLVGNLLGMGTASKEGEKIEKILKTKRLADTVASDPLIQRVLHVGDEKVDLKAILGMIDIVPEKKGNMFNIKMKINEALFNPNIPKDSLKYYGLYITNAVVDAVTKIMNGFIRRKSFANLCYYEEKMKEAKIEKDSSESRLIEFEKENKTIEITDQARTQIQMMTEAQMMTFREQMNLDMLSQERTYDDPVVIAAKNKVKLYEKQYEDVLYGRSKVGYSMGVDKISALKMKALNLTVEAKLRFEIYYFLKQMRIKESFQGAKTAPVLEVVDPAVIPQSLTKLSKSLLLAIGIVGGFLLGIIVVLATKITNSFKENPENSDIIDTLTEIWEEIKRVLFSLLKRKEKTSKL